MKRILFLILLFLISCDRPRQTAVSKQAAAIQEQKVPAFDGTQAFRCLVKQTQFGPRVPNTMAHQRCLEYLVTELRSSADSVVLQEFFTTQPRLGDVKLTNVIAHFNPNNSKRLLLTAHWDSRPWADADKNPKNHNTPTPGANDGASGVAVLVEIARQLKQASPPVGVDLVLFDGEDMGTSGNLDSWCTGSRYFAAHLPAGYLPLFAINLDMIGDRTLTIERELRSERFAPDILTMVFSTAREMNVPQFIDAPGDDVFDDHVPLNQAGIKAIDLIDFSYPDDTVNYWHTVSDTPDKCSAESLEAVGRVLLNVIFKKAPLQ